MTESSDVSWMNKLRTRFAGHTLGTWLIMLLFAYAGLLVLHFLLLGALPSMLQEADNAWTLLGGVLLLVSGLLAFVVVWQLYRLRRAALWWALAQWVCAFAAIALLFVPWLGVALVMAILAVAWPVAWTLLACLLGTVLYLHLLIRRGSLR
ncbi:hypothetical protein COAQ111491_03540 [Comamonas aquatilis]|uniref:hypothetical protein n=1 Tax=Comamonas aquatilis TaxID=1778406 RepID=UPI0039EE550C